MADSKDDLQSAINILYISFMNLVTSPLNLGLVGIIIFLVYKIYKSRNQSIEPQPEEIKLPKLKKDFTVEELRKYDGTQPDGRILVAVNGNVFDVTRKGKCFYGPGGPYSAFGGRDASRGLAKFTVDITDNDYDDLSDLNAMEMESVREWEMQFKEKYEYVGRLLRPGEEPTNYSEEEEDVNNSGESEKEKEKEKPKFE
ncbi:membrane-associated progesterone receptor component, putative [Pediculus humanus corporis]|uniref:Membrane-associated progesterone receptor component, putative n=1 Tax=Pediculus humanus subsp. corporis TaxID=121224 RepID=E0VCF2_PEDHC|nr:membrane-associated progesterone receptor component, putative [Pediculus humanus corporis]EEB11058.1 membrane-associated progesterone receptor component, putative [Pediculus humanus corporis]